LSCLTDGICVDTFRCFCAILGLLLCRSRGAYPLDINAEVRNVTEKNAFRHHATKGSAQNSAIFRSAYSGRSEGSWPSSQTAFF
jgi:hypothetical protein